MNRAAIVPAIALALVVAVLAAGSGNAESSIEPYVGLQAGLSFWPAYSNRDEVEADTGPGYAASILAGIRFDASRRDVGAADPGGRVSDRLGARLEIEVSQRWSPIHGINDGPVQATGDGKWFRATSAHLSLWPSLRFGSAWRVYAGGGGGGTWVRALGSDKRVWSAQAGVGVLVDLPVHHFPLRLDVGWRSFFANSTKLRDAMADYDTHGAILGLHVGF